MRDLVDERFVNDAASFAGKFHRVECFSRAALRRTDGYMHKNKKTLKVQFLKVFNFFVGLL